MTTLEISGLHAAADGTEILKGIDLVVSSGQVHAVMGPNGAGKSTLSAVIMGRPGYEVTAGSITLDGTDVLAMTTWERAVAGLHLVMQYPTEVPGVRLLDVLAAALDERGRGTDGLEQLIGSEADAIGFDRELLARAVNVDLSGGEQKRNETLQLAALAPKIAVLDELDSGLDIDALRACSRRVEELTQANGGDPGLGVLAITHYTRLLQELRCDRVHILVAGRIVAEGGPELADQLEADGYGAFTDDVDDADVEVGGGLDDLFAPPG